MLTQDEAGRFAGIALGHVTREYPNKLDQVLTGPHDLRPPHVLHPIFYGSFDWHSCVHAHWLLAHLLRCHPAMPLAGKIRARFAAAFTAANVDGELGFLARPLTATFERPYGWAWLLMLAAELTRHTDAAARQWASALAPLAQAFAGRFLEYLPKATYPNRAGAHANTAFALTLALDYAETCADHALRQHAAEAARRWYLQDAACQAWEPSGEDFLSPCLMEAVCMRHVLPPAAFLVWFGGFLPRLEQQQPACLFQPATVSDRSDGRIAHLDGLNLTRAWCWSLLSHALPQADPRRPVLQAAAARHLSASLPHVAGDYMGEHWLASFATLALGAADPAQH